jgi:hypothetical protein
VERAAISSRVDPVRLLTNLRDEEELVGNNSTGDSASWVWTWTHCSLRSLFGFRGLSSRPSIVDSERRLRLPRTVVRGGRWKTEERDEAAIFTTGAGRLLGFQKHANRARASNFTDVDFFF